MKHFYIWAVVVLLTGLGLAGCGVSSVPTPPPTLPPTPTLVPTEPPTATPSPTPSPIPPTPTPPPPTPTPIPEGVVNAEPSLNLRASPSTSAKVLGSIPTKAKVTLLGRTTDGEWFKVQSTDFGEGWVKSEFLDINVPAASLPAVTQGAPTSAATATGAATKTPAAITKTATRPPSPTLEIAATPAVGGDYDQYISALLAGTHNRLGNVISLGPAPAGGKVELVIANDSPFAIKVSLGSPARTETRLDACPDCKVYESQGPSTCSPEKPQKTLRIDPGSVRLAIEVDSPDIAPYVGQWTLQGDQKYVLCFYILRNPPQQ